MNLPIACDCRCKMLFWPIVIRIGKVVPEYSSCMKQMYQEAKNAGRGQKRVIITETGSFERSKYRCAHASFNNSFKYFINSIRWSNESGIEIFYFSSFDESWKVEKEGDVGAACDLG